MAKLVDASLDGKNDENVILKQPSYGFESCSDYNWEVVLHYPRTRGEITSISNDHRVESLTKSGSAGTNPAPVII